MRSKGEEQRGWQDSLPAPRSGTHDSELPFRGWTWECDAQGRYSTCGLEVEAVLGIPAQAFLGQALFGFALAPGNGPVLETTSNSGAQVLSMRVQYQARDGRIVPARLHVLREPSTAGAPGAPGLRGFTEVLQPTAARLQPAAGDLTAELPATPKGMVPSWIAVAPERAGRKATAVSMPDVAPRTLDVAATLQQYMDRNAALLIRLAATTGVLVFAGALSFRVASGNRNPLLLMLAYFGALGALVALHSPEVGIIAVIIASLLVPFAIGTGTQTSIGAGLLLVSALTGLWLFDMVARQQRIQLWPSRPTLPLLVFVGLAALSFGVGQLNWLPTAPAPLRAQAGGLAVFVLSAAAFLMVANQVRSLTWLAGITWVFLGCGAIFIAGQLSEPVRAFSSRIIQPGATGGLLWTWLVALAAAQALFNQRLSLPWRIALGLLAAATLVLGLGPTRQSWTSGWLPGLVALAAVVLAGRPRLGLALVSIGIVIAVVYDRGVFGLGTGGGNQYSFVTRLEAWSIVLQITRLSPLFGLGPANYYWYTPLFPILGYAVQFNSHSNYVDILAQTGVLGLAAFLWFVWELGRLGWRLRPVVPEGFGRAYLYGALGGLAGTVVAAALGDWVLPFVYNIGLDGMRASILGWLFLGGIVVLERLQHTQANQASRV